MDLPFSLNEPRFLILLVCLVPVIMLGRLSARARPRDRARINASTALRSLILTLIILALAGLQWIGSSGAMHVVVLLDESGSVSKANRDAEIAYVDGAARAMGPDDHLGVVRFGEQAIVDRALSPEPSWRPGEATPALLATNIEEAIQIGSALFPEGGAKKLVLLSDGAETAGKAAELASQLRASGIQLSVVPLGERAQNEVAVDQVISPNSVPSGQKYEVRALVRSTNERQAVVTLRDGDKELARKDVALTPGNNAVSFSLEANEQGFHILTANVTSADDRSAENNAASSFTIVRKPPVVLIVAGAPEDAAPLQAALTAGKVESQVVKPGEMPRLIENLDVYDSIILANASSQAIGDEGQRALQSYVRDSGKGLVMIGGDQSYGAGGFLHSPLEEVLPVNMDVRSSDERASIAMTFVVDKSGSMGRCHCAGNQQFDPAVRTEYGVSKIEIIKQAIGKATAIMRPADQVGVLGFDDLPHWLLNIQQLGTGGQDKVRQSLQPVQAMGDTHIFVGLQAAADALAGTDAQIKHLVLLSDGWTKQADFSDLVGQVTARGMTLSTVATGEGSGEILKEMATKGGGEYYHAADTQDVPDILLKETVRLIGSYFIEESTKPSAVGDSTILKDMAPSSLPLLLGYNSTTLKPNAQLMLQSPRGDPLLAGWQYGLGKSVAWTSDAKGRWAANWVAWPEFPRFIGQMLAWTLPGDDPPGLQVNVALAPGRKPTTQDATVRLEAHDSGGAPRNSLDTRLVLTGTQGLRTEVPLLQSAPGVYEVVAPGLSQGVYQAEIQQGAQNETSVTTVYRTGITVGYPSEYRLAADGGQEASTLLADLARLGGGHMLNLSEPRAVWARDVEAQPSRVRLWPWLLLAAVILFPFDVAVRRLTISWADLIRVVRRRQ
ncbi:MAG TPA: VWA domain-containing protein [Chloroflexia bacterium]|nr:VWA domain-containing protein [Chloroflexia bacterium]